MLESCIVETSQHESPAAGGELGVKLRAGFGGRSPDALILFASPHHDFQALLGALHENCAPAVLIGCSSAGEFTSAGHGQGLACAVGLRSDEMTFSAGLGKELRRDREGAARQTVAAFRGLRGAGPRHRTAILFTDALAGYAEELVESLTALTGGQYQFVGGGSGDDARFDRTHVFCGREIATDAVVALEVLSSKPLGIGVRHGWKPVSAPMRVTDARGMRLLSLDAAPAVEALVEHAAATGQTFDPAAPLPFFLHNVIGIESGSQYKLRVPLSVEPDGSLLLAADVPARALVRIMMATGATPADAAAAAATDALAQLGGRRPKVALFFDCVATRLRLGQEFGLELAAIGRALGPAGFAGFNTYGQIARAEGQFSGFHNCTAVTCVFPE